MLPAPQPASFTLYAWSPRIAKQIQIFNLFMVLPGAVQSLVRAANPPVRWAFNPFGAIVFSLGGPGRLFEGDAGRQQPLRPVQLMDGGIVIHYGADIAAAGHGEQILGA